ncbi:hypothetical protein BD626DRAFT_27171 [Schizophyllum amplum]|uniref:Uncharacterized protein n=1 Tax=Schizophyllum amplum TaxID=97359 RepID=A0A550CZV0_9AGAR|nr:hypothetical protein BD626DRAFT_27171 [Auriculariopsis ampla]
MPKTRAHSSSAEAGASATPSNLTMIGHCERTNAGTLRSCQQQHGRGSAFSLTSDVGVYRRGRTTAAAWGDVRLDQWLVPTRREDWWTRQVVAVATAGWWAALAVASLYGLSLPSLASAPVNLSMMRHLYDMEGALSLADRRCVGLSGWPRSGV